MPKEGKSPVPAWIQNSLGEMQGTLNNQWVIDRIKDFTGEPYKFRSRSGVSVSGSLTAENIRNLAESSPSRHLVVFDAREESHGILQIANGGSLPISKFLAAHDNSGNSDLKTHSEILQRESAQLAQLNAQIVGSDMTFPVYEDVKKTLKDSNYKTRQLSVQGDARANSIGSVCRDLEEQLGRRIDYVRVPTPDHGPPSSEQIDRYLKIIKEIPQDAHVHYHCKGGSGRSPSLALMRAMVIENSLPDSDPRKAGNFVDFQKKYAGLLKEGGSMFNLVDGKQRPTGRLEALQERDGFLQEFYKYTQSKGSSDKSWSEWKKEDRRESSTHPFRDRDDVMSLERLSLGGIQRR